MHGANLTRARPWVISSVTNIPARPTGLYRCPAQKRYDGYLPLSGGGSIIDDRFPYLATPIFFPAIIKLGYDPLWAGIMLCLTVVVGGVIPPVAMNVFIVKNITKVPIGVIYKGVYPFLISMIFLIVLIFIFPQIVLYLPQTLMK
jgi:hypothetical protein